MSAIVGQPMTCIGVNNCPSGSGNSASCTVTRKLCVKCFTRSSQTWIRVQTNSFPSHCFDAAVTPDANNLEFEVPFSRNPSTLLPVSLNPTQYNTQVCTFNSISSTPPSGIVILGGDLTGVVAIARTGSPIK